MKGKMLMASGRTPGAGNGTPKTRDPAHNGIAKRVRKAARIVIIEDNPNDLILLKRALEKRFGQKIAIPGDLRETTSLDDAKELIVKHSPDVIISDKDFCKDPEAHFQALDFAKDNDPDISVILVSGTVEDCDRERIEPFAYDHVIEKTGRYGSIEKVAELVEKLLRIPETEKPEEIKQTQKKAKVIVIDDEKHIVIAICRVLKNCESLEIPEGIPATKSFEQAKELIERHSPDIVISDKQIWTVSKGDHLEILRFIQENYPNTKVILSSSAIEEKDQQAGFDAFISKPLDPRKMIAIVEKLAKKE